MNQLDQIVATCYTKKQSIKRLRLIKDFLNFYFFDLNPQTNFEQAFAEFQKQEMLKSSNFSLRDVDFLRQLGPLFIKTFQPSSFHLGLEELEKQLTDLKAVSLYLPFELPEVEVERLGIWFKKSLGNSSLFEVIFDPSLIGGAALSVNGIYKDYSLKQKIKDSKDQIARLLTAFNK